jgi:hypothetical protein
MSACHVEERGRKGSQDRGWTGLAISLKKAAKRRTNTRAPRRHHVCLSAARHRDRNSLFQYLYFDRFGRERRRDLEEKKMIGIAFGSEAGRFSRPYPTAAATFVVR